MKKYQHYIGASTLSVIAAATMPAATRMEITTDLEQQKLQYKVFKAIIGYC